jgi:hypothetical protein
MSTDRNVERRLSDAQANLGLEPLARVLDQVDDGNGGAADMGGEPNHVIEVLLQRGIENAIAAQGDEALAFVPWGIPRLDWLLIHRRTVIEQPMKLGKMGPS